MRTRMKNIAAITAITLALTGLTACDDGKMKTAEDLANKVAELVAANDMEGLQAVSLDKVPKVTPDKPVENITVEMGDANDMEAEATLSFDAEGEEKKPATIQMKFTEDGWKVDDLGGLVFDFNSGYGFTINGDTPKQVMAGIYSHIGFDNGYMSGEWEDFVGTMSNFSLPAGLEGHTVTVNDNVKSNTDVINAMADSLYSLVAPCLMLEDVLGSADTQDNATLGYSLEGSCRAAGGSQITDITIKDYEPEAPDGRWKATVSVTVDGPTGVFEIGGDDMSPADYLPEKWACEPLTDGDGVECGHFEKNTVTLPDAELEFNYDGSLVDGKALPADVLKAYGDAVFPGAVPAN